MEIEPLQMTPVRSVRMNAESHLGETLQQPEVKTFGELLTDALKETNALEKKSDALNAALAAGDVSLAAHAHPYAQSGHAGAKRRDLTDILMADDHGRLDVSCRPVVPVIDMDVCAADCSLMNVDKYLSWAGLRDGDLPQFQSGCGGRLDDRIHHLHGVSSIQKHYNITKELNRSVLHFHYNPAVICCQRKI